MKNDRTVKLIISEIGSLIDARAKTTETLIMAEIKATENRLTRRIEVVEHDISELKNGQENQGRAIERLEKSQEKQDIAINRLVKGLERVEQKLDQTAILQKQVDELRKRLDKLEVELESERGKN